MFKFMRAIFTIEWARYFKLNIPFGHSVLRPLLTLGLRPGALGKTISFRRVIGHDKSVLVRLECVLSRETITSSYSSILNDNTKAVANY